MAQVFNNMVVANLLFSRILQLVAKSWLNQKPEEVRKLQALRVRHSDLHYSFGQKLEVLFNRFRINFNPLFLCFDEFFTQVPYIMHHVVIANQLHEHRCGKHHKYNAENDVALEGEGDY